MTLPGTALLIPAEEQVRELDAKLLLACTAAERGFRAVLGARHEMHLRVASLPRGIYFAKSFRSLSLRIFDILRDLGSEIAACDEEALVPYPDDLYFDRRVSPETLARISVLFAWGPASAALFRRCPGYAEQPVHPTGNPRADLMRPELREYHAEEVADLRRRFGDFLLVNTNFGTVNHYVPQLGWLTSVMTPGSREKPSAYVTGLAAHRRALFSHFQELIPLLSRAFPDRAVVVRPHPVESHEVWNQIAARCENVRVVQEGNVVPWLLAARAMVHNGCTTSLEAYVLGRPSIAYLPVVSEVYDTALPNRLGYRAHDAEELCETLRRILAQGLGAPDAADQKKLIEEHLSGLEGPLASDRIVDVLAARVRERGAPARPAALPFARSFAHAHTRAWVKRVQGRFPGNASNAAYQRHRFPDFPAEELEARIARLGRALGRFGALRVRRIAPCIYEISG
jgi:surface carbohydrate biosynthesis protein